MLNVDSPVLVCGPYSVTDRRARGEAEAGLGVDAVYWRCMSAIRTQVYLTESQRERIDRMARARGVTMAEVIRSALDEYLVDDADAAETLAATFGADLRVSAPSRDEWDRG